MMATEHFRASAQRAALVALVTVATLVLALLVDVDKAWADTQSFTWTGEGKDHKSWTDPCNWQPKAACADDKYPGSEGPLDIFDTAEIRAPSWGPAHVVAPTNVTVAELQAIETPGGNNVYLDSGGITVTGFFDFTGVEIGKNMTITTAPTAAGFIENPVNSSNGTVTDETAVLGTINNAGLMTLTGPGSLDIYAYSDSTGHINNTGTFQLLHGTTISGTVCCVGNVPTFKNSGTLETSANPTNPSADHATLDMLKFENEGNISFPIAGVLEFHRGIGHILQGTAVTGNGTFRVTDTASLNMTSSFTVDKPSAFELAEDDFQGRIDGTGTMNGDGTFLWTGGEMQGNLTIGSNGELDIIGAAPKHLEGMLTTKGATYFSGKGHLIFGQTLVGDPAVLDNSGTFTAYDGSVMEGEGCCTNPAAMRNGGTFKVVKRDWSTTNTVDVRYMDFRNYGTLQVGSGATLRFKGRNYRQTNGLTRLMTDGTLAQDVGHSATIEEGRLVGTGTIAGTLANVKGRVVPGKDDSSSTGILTVTGNYYQGPSAVLDVDLNGTVPGTEYDRLKVGGEARLRGTLRLVTGYNPFSSAALKVLTFKKRTGKFDVVSNNYLPNSREWYAQYNTDNVTLKVKKR